MPNAARSLPVRPIPAVATAPANRPSLAVRPVLAALCCAGLTLALLAGPAHGQDYRPNAVLGEALAKQPYIKTKTNPGGKGVLDNSCIYKDSFSMTPSETVLDRCDVAAATAEFTAKYGPPAQTAPAPGGKMSLEYHLLHNENSYLIKYYLGCAGDKTERFAMVECRQEKNRAKPGPPPDNRSLWKKLTQ
ncbi:hypothetical protein [Solidesulfovibrio sp.]